MTGAYRPFRIIKKRATGVLYVAMPDLLSYFEQMKRESKTTLEEDVWQKEVDRFSTMIYEGLDHDL